MTTIARRRLLATAGATLGVTAAAMPARAAEFNYKFGTTVPTNHPAYIQASRMASRIKTETNGRVDIQIFPNSQLGSDTDMLSQLRGGALEMELIPGLVLSTLVPVSSIDGIGFAFPDYGAVWSAMDGELGRYIRTQITKTGVVVMDKMWDNGFRQITASDKPIQSVSDLRNLKIRVPVSPLWTSMFKAFGSSPTSISFAETYSALQTHIVESEENPLVVIETTKLYEVQKYCSLTNHMWDGYWVLFNRSAWNDLPADLQVIVAKHVNQAAEDERTDIAKMNGGLQASLESKGMVFNEPDRASFQQALREAGFYKQWKATYGDEPWALLEKAAGKLS